MMTRSLLPTSLLAAALGFTVTLSTVASEKERWACHRTWERLLRAQQGQLGLHNAFRPDRLLSRIDGNPHGQTPLHITVRANRREPNIHPRSLTSSMQSAIRRSR